ncbi:MAG TPA: hypothetical protein IAC26_06600 [Candidatus Scatomorpha stercoravium]|nr:hypothetical protein [Candidatus Scatomorpha stercoravium]
MSKKAKITLIICLAALPLILIAAFLLAALPYINAASSMPEGASLSFLDLGGGEYALEWTASPDAARYYLSIDGGERSEPLTENAADVGPLSEGEHSFTVTPLGSWKLFGKEYFREGESVTVTVPLVSPEAPEAEWIPDEDAGTLSVEAEPLVGRSYELRIIDAGGERPLDSTLADGELGVSFGEDGDLPMPEYETPYRFCLRAVVNGQQYEITGPAGEEYTLKREALLPDTSSLTSEELGENRYALSWTEAKGDWYEIQYSDGGEWETLATVECTEELRYETEALRSVWDYSFRVMGADEGAEEGEYVSESDVIDVTTELSPLYCTIWPLMELPLYESADAESETLASVPAASTLCVLAEEDGFFRVRYGETYGYLSSSYCMINLPEYMGKLIGYDITNSYASKYAVHGYEIPEVTGEVVKGYEHVCLAEGVYLAPYLYPCCEKLYTAANAALEQGYRLKIYDSYRPNQATVDIYNKAELMTNQPVPELDIYGEVPEELPELAEGQTLTYRMLWEDGTYGLPNFLAKGGSMHNMGIALDLTLERVDSGEELEMQSDMHDLSIYSVINRDNDEALILDNIMKAAGFGGLTSEWWHFQDNETRKNLSLNTYMWAGVSIEGWHASDGEWYYLDSLGTVTERAERGEEA